MLRLPPSPSRAWHRVARRGLVSSLLLVSALYALLGNELWHRCGARLGIAVNSVTEVLSAVRLRLLSGEIRQANIAFEELTACRDALEHETRFLEVKRAEVAGRLQRQETALFAILAVLKGDAVPAAVRLSQAEIEADATEVLQRLQADRAELQKFDSALAQLAQARLELDEKILAGQRSLRQRTEDLQCRQARLAGWQAYSRGLDRAREVEDAHHNGARGKPPLLAP